MKALNNKWMRAAIPALLLHCSIGTVYCWSFFKEDIAAYLDRGISEVEWAFSLAIFFLGISAAFAGDIVEKNIKVSAAISTVCFNLGLVLTGVSLYYKSLLGILLSYGVLMGIGLGVGYLTPVKTLMLWFKEQKGLATGIAVAGFGLAKVIASPLIEKFKVMCGVDATATNGLENLYKVFFILAAIYTVMMVIGMLLIRKPEGWVEEHSDMKLFDYVKKPLQLGGTMFKKPVFIGIWLMFYINITAGLALISQEKVIYDVIGLTAVGVMGSVTAAFNAGGRLVYSAASDKLKDRNSIYKLMFILSIAVVGVNIAFGAINNSIIPLVVIMLCVINSTYGGGFSNIPTLLSDRYGMKSVSKIHGLALTAWAIAGLTGNQMAAFVVNKAGEGNEKIGFNRVLYIIGVMYVIALVISFVMVKPKKEEIS